MSTTIYPKTIKLKKYSDTIEEYIASATIIPGELLELDSDGKVKPHATAGGNVGPIMFALEDELQGEGIDDTYATNDPVQVWIPKPGDEVYAILADGQNAAKGNFLESAGSGALAVHSSDISDAPNITNQIVAVALEAVNRSGSTEDSSSPLGGDYRIKVKIV